MIRQEQPENHCHKAQPGGAAGAAPVQVSNFTASALFCRSDKGF